MYDSNNTHQKHIMKYMFVSLSCDLFLNNCKTIIKNILDKRQFEEGLISLCLFGLIICYRNTCCITHQSHFYDYIWLGLHQFLINWYGVLVDCVTTTNSNKLLSIQQTDSPIQTNTTNNKILNFFNLLLKGVPKNFTFFIF